MATVSIRYIVDDVTAAIAFYRDELGFRLDTHPAPSFAMLSRGPLGSRSRSATWNARSRRSGPVVSRSATTSSWASVESRCW
jgi:catechol 2,3-dioxygenase-like lactoylglutathione lyase family enzyme